MQVTEQTPVPQDMQLILDKYGNVSANPKGLPPIRNYDHTIPLIPGARPISMRPYRIAPHWKDELDK